RRHAPVGRVLRTASGRAGNEEHSDRQGARLRHRLAGGAWLLPRAKGDRRGIQLVESGVRQAAGLGRLRQVA
nr:hypothetical protein [Tanacetum cinerariifolium]